MRNNRTPHSLSDQTGQLKFILLIAIAFVLAAGLFVLQIFCDNKYREAFAIEDGALMIDAAAVGSLAEGWSVYDGVLMPDELEHAQPIAQNVKIGEQSVALDGHDGLTYAIELQGEGNYSIFFQEVFSSYRLFVQGRLLGGEGDPDQRKEFIRDRVYSFSAQGRVTMVVQTYNRSRAYDGLYYPPVLGNAQSVMSLVSGRLMLYGVAAVLCVCTGLFVLFLRKSVFSKACPKIFAAFALTAGVSFLYPFIAWSGFGLPWAVYLFEDLILSGVLLLSVWLSAKFSVGGGARVRRFAGSFGIGFALLMLCAPLFSLIDGFSVWLGIAITTGKLILSFSALLLAAMAVIRAIKDRTLSSIHALCLVASGVYALALLVETAVIGLFEPLHGLWIKESGALIAVIAYAALLILSARRVAIENQRLNKSLETEVNRKTVALDNLLVERRRTLRVLAHDLKSPLSAACTALELASVGTRTDLQAAMERLVEVRGLIQMLDAIEERGLPHLETVCVNDILSEYYAKYRDDIEVSGATFAFESCTETLWVKGNREELTRVLDNLLFNAASFAETEQIRLTLHREGAHALLQVEDDGPGIEAEFLEIVFEPCFTSRSEAGGQGLGLYIVKQIVQAHGGNVVVTSKGRGTTFSIRIPLSDEQAVS